MKNLISKITEKNLQIFWVILGIGFFLRLLFIFFQTSPPHYEFPVGMDEVNYLELSENILKFKVFGAWSENFFTRSTRSPVYPAFLAVFKFFLGHSERLPQFINLFIDTLNIILLYQIAVILFGIPTGLFSSAFYAVYAPAFMYLQFATSDILSVFLFLLITLSIVCIRKFDFRMFFFILIYSIGIHIKPVLLLASPFATFAMFLCLRMHGEKHLLIKGFSILLCIYLLCLPWGIRNYLIHHSFVPVCTVAGWHLYDSAKTAEELNPEMLMKYIYAPEKNKYTESDYFNEGMKELRAKIFENPLKNIYSGFLRIAYFWLPSKPWFRIFLPHAYLQPVRFGNSFVLPLPDFEGFIYAILIFLISICSIKKKLIFQFLLEWFSISKSVLIFLCSYILAHVFGFPMTQYRFVAEPVFLILGFGLAFSVVKNTTKGQGNEKYFVFALKELAIVSIIFVLIAALSLSIKQKYPKINYSDDENISQASEWNYQTIRKYQRNNWGKTPTNAKIKVTGIVKYIKPGQKFQENKSVSVKDKNYCSAKLYLDLFDINNPIGKGDIKLNLTNNSIPKEHSKIIVYGTVFSGLYRELIINVEEWKYPNLNP